MTSTSTTATWQSICIFWMTAAEVFVHPVAQAPVVQEPKVSMRDATIIDFLLLKTPLGWLQGYVVRVGDWTTSSLVTSCFLVPVLHPTFIHIDNVMTLDIPSRRLLMYSCSLTILAEAENWHWPDTQHLSGFVGVAGGRFKSTTPKFLAALIIESHKLNGSILDTFWHELGKCDPKLKDNIQDVFAFRESLVNKDVTTALFAGLERKQVNFAPLFKMAQKYFQLIIAFKNLGGRNSASDDKSSVSNVASLSTETLLNRHASDPRCQATLKELVFRRDGTNCPISGDIFTRNEQGWREANLAHIVPNGICNDRYGDLIKCLIAFAGQETADLVMTKLNTLSNVLNLEVNVHLQYEKMDWGIEALEEDNGKIRYVLREMRSPFWSRGYALKDGDEIHLGHGDEGMTLEGPSPALCNLALGIRRVVMMCGAAGLIAQIEEYADDSDFEHIYIASEEFCKILDAKLILEGAANDLNEVNTATSS